MIACLVFPHSVDLFLNIHLGMVDGSRVKSRVVLTVVGLQGIRHCKGGEEDRNDVTEDMTSEWLKMSKSLKNVECATKSITRDASTPSARTSYQLLRMAPCLAVHYSPTRRFGLGSSTAATLTATVSDADGRDMGGVEG